TPYLRQRVRRVVFWHANDHIGNSISVTTSQAGDSVPEPVSLLVIRIVNGKENTVIRAAEDKSLTAVYPVQVEVGVVGNPDKHVRDTVMINISNTGYGEAEETAKLREIQGLLKKRVVEFSYLPQSCAVDEESSSHILRRTNPIGTTKL